MKRIHFINRGQRLSPSARKIIKLRQRAFQSGGASLELQVPTNYIREVSRDLNYDITSDASLIMTPNTIGESRLFNCKPELRNLVKYSEELDNAIWVKSNSSIASNTIANPIDGLVNADKLVEDINNDTHSLTQSINYVFNGIYTFSMYVKSGGRDVILIQPNGGVFSSQPYGYFNVSTGTFITGVGFSNPTVTSLLDGWFKISIGLFGDTVSSSSFNFNLFLNQTGAGTISYLGDGTSGVYVYGIQVEQGSTVTPYQRTTDGIIDFQATRATTATVVRKDGSIGDSCYNLFQRSEEIENSYWLKNGVVATANSIANPINGLITADTVSQNGVAISTSRRIFQNVTLAGTYTLSVYVKKKDFDGVGLNIISNNTKQITVNIVNGSVITTSGSPLYTIESLKDGWYRVSISTINDVNINRVDILHCDASGASIFNDTNTLGNYIYGTQLVQGLIPRDYFKTTNKFNLPSIDYTLGSSLPALLVEPARTNIIFPSATATTQTRTVTAQMYALSFYGTGSVALSGTHSATIPGTGANILTTYTFTPTAGSLTFTITGSVTQWQVEAGSNYTSRIVTTTAAVTRNAYTSFVDMFNNSLLNKDNFTLFVEGYLRFGDTTNISFGLSDTIATGARANDIGFFDGIKATYAVGSTVTSDTTNISNENYYKFVIQRNGTSVKFFRNGAQIWTTQTIAVFDYRYLVLNTGGSTFMIQKIALWKSTKTDAECITLTT